jgi:hypothetical protein
MPLTAGQGQNPAVDEFGQKITNARRSSAGFCKRAETLRRVERHGFLFSAPQGSWLWTSTFSRRKIWSFFGFFDMQVTADLIGNVTLGK